jgi:hypothetical protein
VVYSEIGPLSVITVVTLCVGVALVAPARAEDTLNDSIAHELAIDAFQCSSAALKQYALVGTEAADSVADAAFEKCLDKWVKYADYGGKILDSSGLLKEAQSNCEKLRGLDCPTRLPGSYYTLQAAKRTFVAKAVAQVLDIRTAAKP